jgi:manganese/zinc/iron transport system substrate-binding protein
LQLHNLRRLVLMLRLGCNKGIRMFAMTRRSLLAGAGALAALSAPGRALAQDGRLAVVATTGMIADAVAQVGGGRVGVQALMGPGVDPHTYRQTRSDIAALTSADAVFWHGLYLEAQLEDLFHQLAETGTVVALAESLPAERLLGSADYQGRPDPHVWMDPALWAGVVGAARDALAGLDPEGERTFHANAEAHLAEIAALGDYSARVLATVPEEARVLITAHDAFNYFGRAYGYEVMGIQGISTESEAGLAGIEALVAVLVDRGIGAIFVESSVSDRNVMALIEGAAARGHEVTIGGQLFSDAMGDPGTYEGTYIGMIDHNVTTIARALGGEAPETGMSGRLGQ